MNLTMAAPALARPASLYVGDLHPDVTDSELYDAFTEFPSLTSVRVCRDLSTRRSLGYGYVNFVTHEDALHAIEVKNHSTLNGKAIRVSWSHRDPNVRRSGAGNVFIKNLNDTIDSAKLQDTFQKFGNIVSCKVAVSEDGTSKGYGFVQFETEESANAAIENINGSVVEGKQIYVGKFVKKSDRTLPSSDEKYTNLYIKNLDPNISEELLRKKCSEFGKITSLVIVKDENGGSKGFGFVNFENPDDARRATETMDESELGSKILYVARAQKKTERQQSLRHVVEERRKAQVTTYQGSNVYVKNIDDAVTDDELRELFSQCGKITSAKLMLDDKGVSKGFGFVCFSTPEEAYKAVSTFHGFMFRQKPLYVAIAQKKEDRKSQLQLMFGQQIERHTGPSAVVPGGYPPLYYPRPGVLQVPARPGMLYQPLGYRPGWMVNGFANPIRPAFQSFPASMIPGTSQRQRQNRGKKNGQMPVPYVPHLMQSTQLVASSKESSNPLSTEMVKYAPSVRSRDMSSAGINIVGSIKERSEYLSSMLSAAPPKLQKHIIREHLFPLVSRREPDLAAKITRMLLEMDNSEILLLLESPESMEAKIEEAVEVIKLSETEVVSSEDSLSAKVAVN